MIKYNFKDYEQLKTSITTCFKLFVILKLKT